MIFTQLKNYWKMIFKMNKSCETCKYFKEDKETLFDWVEGECKKTPVSVFKFGEDLCDKYKRKTL